MRLLRDLALPTALALAVGLIVLVALLLFDFNRYIAGSISIGILAFGIPMSHSLLSRRTARRRVAVEGPPTLASYSMGPVSLFLLGTLWLLGVSLLVDALNGVAMGADDIEFGPGVAAITPLTWIIMGWTAFCVGQWIGRRAKWGAVALASAVVIAVEFGINISNYIFLPPDAYLSVYGLPRQLKSLLLGVSLGTIGILLPTMLGVWRGARTQRRAYLNYILELLPKDTQGLLVDMAREEAYRLALPPLDQPPGGAVARNAQDREPKQSGGAGPMAAIVRSQWSHPLAVPLLSFLTGIATILIPQAIASRAQSVHAARENRFAALRAYATACDRLAVSEAQLANLPIHFAGIEIDNLASREKQNDRIYQLYDEATKAWRANIADLAAQREVVNALFRTKVEPFSIISKDVPPEFNALPGGFDADEFVKRIGEDPMTTFKKVAPALGRDSHALSSYCSESVQALSKETD